MDIKDVAVINPSLNERRLIATIATNLNIKVHDFTAFLKGYDNLYPHVIYGFEFHMICGVRIPGNRKEISVTDFCDLLIKTFKKSESDNLFEELENII